MNVLRQPLPPTPHARRDLEARRSARNDESPLRVSGVAGSGRSGSVGLAGSSEGLPSNPAPAARGGYAQAQRAYADARGAVQTAPVATRTAGRR